jgi:hypothetical protein
MPVDFDVPLIDHHCHGLVPRTVTRRELGAEWQGPSAGNPLP